MQRVEKSIRVKAPAAEAYQFWRNFENFPKFMHNVEAVQLRDPRGKMSHWKIKGPLGTHGEFDAELTQDQPNKSIGWNSRSGGNMESSGNVLFEETADNTVVHVVMQWTDPPAGAVGEAASKVLMDPEKMLEEDLQRFKDLVEQRVGSGSRR